jgi:hypothetical protein
MRKKKKQQRLALKWVKCASDITQERDRSKITKATGKAAAAVAS